MPTNTTRLSLSKPESDDLVTDFQGTVDTSFDTLDANALIAKGAWAGGTAYVINDVVVVAGRAYRCILANTGQQPPNASYWEPWGGDIAAGGALAGSYPNPSLAAAAVSDTNVASGAAIAQSKIASLTTDLAAKEATANKGAASGYAALVTGRVPTAQLASGTANNTTFLRGDQTWATVAGGSGTPSGAAGGSLTGSYPNPTLAASSVGDSNVDVTRPIGRDKLVAPETIHLIGGVGNPAFENSWANVDAGWMPAGYWLDASSGIVHFQGSITNASNPTGNSIFWTMPVGWRPPFHVVVGSAAHSGTAGSTVATRMVLTSAGVFYIANDLAAGCIVNVEVMQYRVA